MKGATLIFVTIARDGDDMLDALILADQPRACDGALILANATQGDVAAINLLACASRRVMVSGFRPP